MIRMIAALVGAWLLVLFMGPKVIPFLRKLHFGQTIYDLGPQSHQKKQGTPVMGGLMIVCAVTLLSLLLHPGAYLGKWDMILALLAVSLLSMLVGFADDYIKAVKKRHEGLTPWQKIAGQIVIAVAFSAYCYLHPMVGSKIDIPFFHVQWDLGIFYIPLMALVVLFMVNSANLQDGLDGLLSTVTSVSMTGWAAMALIMMQAANELHQAEAVTSYASAALFALAVCGAAMGFLRFNRYPAKIFLGDTGSMFIGGAVVGMAMLTRKPLYMLLMNATLVASSLSVIIQRIYFKVTHGKRIFKMSPIHHHFELSGYTETQIVSMYACFTGILTIASVLSTWLN